MRYQQFKFGRREFLSSTAVALLGALASRPAGGADKEHPKFIDVHTHPGPIWSKGQQMELSVEQLLEWMDQHRVQRACLLPQVSPEARVLLIPPEHMFAAANDHPDRLIPFANIDPRSQYGSVKDLVALLQDFRDRGAKGFGEHKVGLPIDDPLNARVYEACQRAGLPLLFHMDRVRNTDQPGLPGLQRVLESFPDLTFIGHGPGFWANISAEVPERSSYPRGPVKSGGAIDRLMDACPNLVAELSAGSGANAIERDREFGREFLIRRADRVLFGSDYLRPGQEIRQFELLASIELPEKVRYQIHRGNAIRVLKLDDQ